MKDFIEKDQKIKVKKFHTLLGLNHIGQSGKEAILESYGVESSNDLSGDELTEICQTLTLQANPKLAEQDKWRKRVIASISGYHQLTGEPLFQKDYKLCDKQEIERRKKYAKGTAEKAAGNKEFNEIPIGELQVLYNHFLKAQKYVKSAHSFVNADLIRTININLN